MTEPKFPITGQAKYLLRAPAADMERWKATAARRQRSFADHIRICLERHEWEKENGSPVEAAAAAVEGPAGAAAPTGDLTAEPGVPPGLGSPSPVDSSEGRAASVQTPARPPASPELTINRPDLIDEARRLAGRMRR